MAFFLYAVGLLLMPADAVLREVHNNDDNADNDNNVTKLSASSLAQVSADDASVQGLAGSAAKKGPVCGWGDPPVVCESGRVTKIKLFQTKADGELKQVAGLSQYLQLLNVAHTSVKGELRDIAGLSNLWGLDLCHTSVGGDLRDLKGLGALFYLDLSHTPVTGDLRDLAQLHELFYLDIAYTKVGGDLEHLQGIGPLSRLIVSHTEVRGDLKQLAKKVELRKVAVDHTHVSGDVTAEGGMFHGPRVPKWARKFEQLSNGDSDMKGADIGQCAAALHRLAEDSMKLRPDDQEETVRLLSGYSTPFRGVRDSLLKLMASTFKPIVWFGFSKAEDTIHFLWALAQEIQASLMYNPWEGDPNKPPDSTTVFGQMIVQSRVIDDCAADFEQGYRKDENAVRRSFWTVSQEAFVDSWHTRREKVFYVALNAPLEHSFPGSTLEGLELPRIKAKYATWFAKVLVVTRGKKGKDKKAVMWSASCSEYAPYFPFQGECYECKDLDALAQGEAGCTLARKLGSGDAPPPEYTPAYDSSPPPYDAPPAYDSLS